MQWKSLFTKNTDISVEETKEYLGSNQPGSFQLLDVRQEKEYADLHIPGAIPIPLGDLPDRLGDLDQEMKTIVYCRSGVRSVAACQILRDNNFPSVFNMTGGILQWQGSTATGLDTVGLEYFIEGTFANSFEMTFRMEAGLRQFYLILSDRVQKEETASLLRTLAKYEDGHMAKLLAQHNQSRDDIDLLSQPPAILEGGLALDVLSTTFGEHLRTPESILQLAMMFEAQAFDLYGRLARNSSDKSLKSFYLQMATEEQYHLNKLSSELDNLLS